MKQVQHSHTSTRAHTRTHTHTHTHTGRCVGKFHSVMRCEADWE